MGMSRAACMSLAIFQRLERGPQGWHNAGQHDRASAADARKGEASEHLLFAFPTTEPNEVVRPVHAKAMPVILIEETWDTWLEADVATALTLQQPLPASRLTVVATGQRQDAAA
jgi:putative SOS response-associated peptidase YedK